MRVLAAVLAHAGDVALDVAGVLRHVVERRREQRDEAVFSANELLLDRVERGRGALGVASARDGRPRLRDRVDAALLGVVRAERRAVVEVGAAVPRAVPAVLLDGGGEPLRPRAVVGGEVGVAARLARRARSARARRSRNQASHTLSPLPSWPTRFMPSFQSPPPMSGSPCTPTGRPASSARDAVLVDAWPPARRRPAAGRRPRPRSGAAGPR